jgi:magnesium chelatase family protein
VFGVAVVGVQGRLVTVEAHVGRGLPAVVLAGLPGAAVQDARERVRPAVESSGLAWPLRRVVVNLSPAGMRKEGPGFDLPIAFGVLAASAQVPTRLLDGYAFYGELSLKGEIVPTAGVLPVAMAAAAGGLRGVVVPEANVGEAALVEGLEAVGAPTVSAVAAFLRGDWKPEPVSCVQSRVPAESAPDVDFAEVRGQGAARRALEVAAAGAHNVLMVESVHLEGRLRCQKDGRDRGR